MRGQSFTESLKLAFGTLAAHKFRSMLTVLGVIIGTMTVIAVSSLVTGMSKRITEALSKFSADVVLITKFKAGIRFSDLTKEERERKELTYDDMLALRDLPSVQYAAALLTQNNFGSATQITVKYGSSEANNAIIRGTETVHPYIYSLEIAEGRFFTQTEDEHKQYVCVIGSDIASALFPTESGLNKDILIDGKPYRVVGILEKNPSTGLFGGSSRDNSFIYIPHDTFRNAYPANDQYVIILRARPGQTELMKDQATEVLRQRRRVAYNQPNSFEVAGMDAIMDTFSSVIDTIGIIIVPISAFGLLVGGIGVMNIMLVSVTERTREIGIRRAIGARRRDILIQFLIEAATLTGMGGLMGIATGLFISFLLNLLIPDLPSSVPMWSVITGFVVSVSIGLICGLWPAVRAARLDPVEALRYE
ncbi:MAG TPA: ABC transporter permease [Blastocatellia bacterium]|nr:ABC transporter permease [Blastocatellia bacterium]